MKRQAAPYPLRIDAELRSRIEALANANGRSLNAQISLILEAAVQGGSVTDSLMSEDMRDEVRRIALELIREELAKAGK
jgi:hypothetical protein